LSSAIRGTVLAGRYRLDEQIHTNPDGAVWLARDSTLDRRVSVRVMRPNHPFAADVADAARRAALVDDIRLVRVLDVGSDGDIGFVVSEYIDGDSLATLVERSPLAAPAVRRIIGEVAQGLDGAAERGLHHLRLTPRSVIVCRDGSVKVAGTAVEAAAAGLEPDHAATASRVDTVALVALLYSGLTGRWPLGDTGFPPAPRGEGGAPVPPADLVPAVPNDLDTLCVVTLSAPDDGPRSPAELVQQLAPWPSAQQAPLRAAPRRAPVEPLTPNPALTIRGRTSGFKRAAKSAGQHAPNSNGVRVQPPIGPPSVPIGPTAPTPPTPPTRPAPTATPATTAPGSGPAAAPSPQPAAPAGPARRPAAGFPVPSAGPPAALPTSPTPVNEGPPRMNARLSQPTVRPTQTPPGPGQVSARQTPAGQGPARQGPAKQGPAKQGPAKQGPAKQGPARQTPIGRGSTGQGSASQGSASQGQAPSGPAPTRATSGNPVAHRPNPAPAGPATQRPKIPSAGAAGGAGSASGSGSPGGAGSGGGARTGPGSSPSEPLQLWGNGWSGNLRPPSRLESTGPFPIIIPPEAPPREQSRLVIFSVTAALVLVLAVAAFSLRNFGSSGGGTANNAIRPLPTASAVAATPTPAASTAEPTPTSAEPTANPAAKAQIASVRAIDPQGDGDEDSKHSKLAIDDDPSTSWKSDSYRSSGFGGLKHGVGLALKLKTSAQVKSVTIDVQGSGGAVQLRTSNQPDLASSKVVGKATIKSGQVTVRADDAAASKYVILWFTKLPSVDGKYRIEVSEVQLK
jgi:hypothetical protein